MQVKNILAASLTMGALAVASPAFGQTILTWDGGGGDQLWGTAVNWNPNNVPDSAGEIARFKGYTGDPVKLDGNYSIGALEVISNKATSTDSDVTFVSSDLSTPTHRTLSLDADGSTTDGNVFIDASNQLFLGDEVTLRFADADQPSEIGGLLAMETSTSFIEVADSSVTFGPENPGGTPAIGIVDGMNDAAQIRVDTNSGNVTLISEISIRGQLAVVRLGSNTATFDNQWEVVADRANGTLRLGADVKLEDPNTPGAAFWAAIGSGSVLEFDRAADGSDADHPILYGDFALGQSTGPVCSNLVFDADVSTCGDADLNAGEVLVEQGAGSTFEYHPLGCGFDPEAITVDTCYSSMDCCPG